MELYLDLHLPDFLVTRFLSSLLITIDLEIWPLQSNLSRLEELRFFFAIEILIFVHGYTLIYLVSTSVFTYSNWLVHKYETLHSTRYILQEISYFIYVC